MIVTVTPNTALDYTLLVPEFSFGKTIRVSDSVWGMGGKAADASWILGHWGEKNYVMGFSAGMNGHRMEKMLQERGCLTDFVWVNGETRLNIVIASGGQHTTLTSSTLSVTTDHINSFFEKYCSILEQTSAVIVGGSLPQGVPKSFYYDVIHKARQRGISVIFDSSGQNLKAGLYANPTIIKPNLVELADLVNDPSPVVDINQITSLDKIGIYTIAKLVQDRYNIDIVVTMGEGGALALIKDNHYWIPPISVNAVSAAGAGDAVLAGLALSYSQNKPAEEGLRLGFALAHAVLLTPATADYTVADAVKFLDQIHLIPIAQAT